MSETSKVLSFAVPPVVKAVTVRCAPALAFRRFTEDLAADPPRCSGVGYPFEGRVLDARTIWFIRAGSAVEPLDRSVHSSSPTGSPSTIWSRYSERP